MGNRDYEDGARGRCNAVIWFCFGFRDKSEERYSLLNAEVVKLGPIVCIDSKIILI